MRTNKITSEEIADIKVASMPTRPSSPHGFGGKGYTADEIKAAFDRLPLYIIERFNLLLDDISATGQDSIASAIPTGIKDGHTLENLFLDLRNGNAASYIKVSGVSLASYLAQLSARIEELEAGTV